MTLKENVDVLFVIEHLDRENQLALDIKENLENEGYSVKIISSIYHVLLALIKYECKVIVTPSTSFGRGSISWAFENSRIIQPVYINMNYEQFISSWKGKYKTPSHPVSISNQIHLCWGESFKRFLLECGIEHSNIKITGRPSFELLHENYTNKNFKIELAQKMNLDSSKNWNFIGFTDGLAFVDEKKIQNIILQGGDEEGLRNHIKNVKRTIQETLNWIRNIENEKKELFILRPHPSISVTEYIRFIEKNVGYIPSNLVITKEYNAHKWIASSERFFTNYSTLILDATSLNKSYFILNPLNNNTEENWWCSNGPQINSYESFKKLIDGNFKMENNNHANFNSEINYHIEMDKKGKTETINVILSYLAKSEFSQSSTIKIFKTICSCPKRILGSYLRYLLAKNSLTKKYVKSGLQIEFFHFN